MDPMDRNFWRAVSAEFTAMFFFVFICVGCALSTLGIAEGASELALPNATLAISLCFGFTIFVLAHMFGHVSGAHINPAVTVCLMITKQIEPRKGGFYILAQCVGSIVASGILMASMGLRPDAMGGFNALSGPSDNKIARGFVAEFILTAFLCFTVLATVDPNRSQTGLGPLAIGMAVGVAHLILVPITGCGINPARSLGPALFADQAAAREDLWVFILAPLLGGAFAAVAYPFWFAEENFATEAKGTSKFFHTPPTSTPVEKISPSESGALREGGVGKADKAELV